MLSSSCCLRAFSLCGVKFLSRLFTALNLLPSIATTRVAEQPELTTQLDELPAHSPDRLAVVPAEVGDGLEVRRQAPRQPHQLNVALRLALQAPARLQAVEIPVDVDLEQHRRVVRRTPGVRRRASVEAQPDQIKFVDEGIDRAYRVVLGDLVVDTRGQQRDLRSVFPFDESLHVAAQKEPTSFNISNVSA